MEQWKVTAYLIGISPELVANKKLKRQQNISEAKTQESNDKALKAVLDDIEANSSSTPENYNDGVAKVLYEQKCTQCHGLEDVEDYEFTDGSDVEDVVSRMTRKNGFDANETELAYIIYFLKKKFVSK